MRVHEAEGMRGSRGPCRRASTPKGSRAAADSCAVDLYMIKGEGIVAVMGTLRFRWPAWDGNESRGAHRGIDAWCPAVLRLPSLLGVLHGVPRGVPPRVASRGVPHGGDAHGIWTRGLSARSPESARRAPVHHADTFFACSQHAFQVVDFISSSRVYVQDGKPANTSDHFTILLPFKLVMSAS